MKMDGNLLKREILWKEYFEEKKHVFNSTDLVLSNIQVCLRKIILQFCTIYLSKSLELEFQNHLRSLHCGFSVL